MIPALMSTVAESSRCYDTEGRAWSASELLKSLEDGEVHGETPLRISANAPPRPFRRYLRELVWAAYGDEVGSGPKAGADEINKDLKPEKPLETSAVVAAVAAADAAASFTGCGQEATDPIEADAEADAEAKRKAVFDGVDISSKKGIPDGGRSKQ